jgi:hypothetical protein
MAVERKNDKEESLTKSDWIQYLTCLTSNNQNFKLGFYSNIFAALAIVVAILITLPQLGINDPLSKGIVGVMLAIYVYLISREGAKFNYTVNSLKGKSANKLLSEIMSLDHPELKNGKKIQIRWNGLIQKIEKISVEERKKIMKMSTKKIPDEQRFDNWYNDTS